MNKIRNFFDGCMGKKLFYKKSLIVNPFRDWKIIMIISVVIFLVLLSLDLYLYMRSAGGSMFVSGSKIEETLGRLDKINLNKVIDYFKAKEDTKLEMKKTSIIDPSL